MVQRIRPGAVFVEGKVSVAAFVFQGVAAVEHLLKIAQAVAVGIAVGAEFGFGEALSFWECVVVLPEVVFPPIPEVVVVLVEAWWWLAGVAALLVLGEVGELVLVGIVRGVEAERFSLEVGVCEFLG